MTNQPKPMSIKEKRAWIDDAMLKVDGSPWSRVFKTLPVSEAKAMALDAIADSLNIHRPEDAMRAGLAATIMLQLHSERLAKEIEDELNAGDAA